jgi:tetratricopeptide (TPR) repeat protein
MPSDHHKRAALVNYVPEPTVNMPPMVHTPNLANVGGRILPSMLAALTAGWIFGQTILEPDLQRFERLIANGLYEEALPKIEAYVAVHPESSTAQYQLGYVYFRLHRIMASVKALSKALSVDAKNADAHRILGYDLNILGRLDLAVIEFERATELQPDSAENHYALGRVYYERGSYERSAAELEEALRIDPSSVKTEQSLGLAYEALNDLARAREHLLKAVERNEHASHPSEWPFINLAAFHNRRGDYRTALSLAQRALAITARSEAAHFQAGKAYSGLEQWDSCVRELRAGIELDPSNPEFFYTLAIAYRRLGDQQQAQVSMRQYEKLKVWEASAAMTKRSGEPE